MRVQNRKVTDALAAVLQQHGLDPNLANDPDALIAQANQARIEEEAKRQNVPTELLQRLTDLEARDREAQQKRLADAALAGFQAVKNQFGLDNQGISAFAKQLQEAGTNPFEQEMDLVHHYKLHNLDKIIAAETQKAVEAALKNQKSSTQFSTQPSKTQGKESTGTEQIDTMAKFDRFLMGLK
jgi:L-aminopeptidase/D-esterase-like protein